MLEGNRALGPRSETIGLVADEWAQGNLEQETSANITSHDRRVITRLIKHLRSACQGLASDSRMSSQRPAPNRCPAAAT